MINSLMLPWIFLFRMGTKYVAFFEQKWTTPAFMVCQDSHAQRPEPGRRNLPVDALGDVTNLTSRGLLRAGMCILSSIFKNG